MAPASASVDITLEAAPDPVQVGRTVFVEIVLTNTLTDTAQEIVAVDVLLEWDPNELRLTGFEGPVVNPWIAFGFLQDPDGINGTFDDGDALFNALSFPDAPVAIASGGDFAVATLEFLALKATPDAELGIPAAIGTYGRTRVFAPSPPQTDVLGTAQGTQVEIFCTSCPGDVDGDNDADINDLTILLASFGSMGPPGFVLADLDCDGEVTINDLTILLALFGTSCP